MTYQICICQLNNSYPFPFQRISVKHLQSDQQIKASHDEIKRPTILSRHFGKHPLPLTTADLNTIRLAYKGEE